MENENIKVTETITRGENYLGETQVIYSQGFGVHDAKGREVGGKCYVTYAGDLTWAVRVQTTRDGETFGAHNVNEDFIEGFEAAVEAGGKKLTAQRKRQQRKFSPLDPTWVA